MKSKQLHEVTGLQTLALVFETGDKVMSLLSEFAAKNGLSGSHFTAIGAFQNVTLGYFDWKSKDYQQIPVNEQVEVVALIGDIATGSNDKPKVHAHVVIGRSDGTAMAGHLLEATVRPTLELVITESPTHLRRVHDEATGLALIQL
jgi:uncharacterized protein